MKIQQSAEDYLETILVLSRRKPMIRSIDIVNELGFSKPSVSIAMKNLRENGYISMDHEGYITLEPSGREIAETIYERHTMLTELLVALGVNRETAVEDACRIEHVVSSESFAAIKKHVTEKTSVPGRHYTIKHIYTAFYTLQYIYRCTDSHQIAGLVFG